MIAPPKGEKLQAGKQQVGWRWMVWDKRMRSVISTVAGGQSSITASVADKPTHKSAEFRLKGMEDQGDRSKR